MPFLTALSAVSSVLGIVSFFTPDEADADRQQKFDDLLGKLDELQSYSTSDANALIGQSLGSSDTALNALLRYAGEEDADTRTGIGQDAIQLADLGLNEVIRQINANLSTASVETLAYAYHALSFAMSVRIEVAKVVEDGPIGSEGLHARLKSAAELLYNEEGSGDLVSALEARILSDITVTEENTSFEISSGTILIPTTTVHSGYEVVATGGVTGETATRSQSPLADIEVFFLWQTDAIDDALNPIPSSLGNTLRQSVYEFELEAVNINAFKDGGVQANSFLAATAAAAAENDISLTQEDDVYDGTALSDYLQGKSGDDTLSGLQGPDALSGDSGNDILRGGDSDDFLRGGSGQDMLMGGLAIGAASGVDTARFEGLFEEYEVRGGQEYATVTGPGGARDKVFDVTFLRFDDQVIELAEGTALAGAGAPEDFVTAERVALLYEAALDRDGNIDLPGLNFYIDVTERDGLSDEFLAADLMTSPEFTASFGDAETLTNAAFLEQIYLNVLDRASDAAGRQFYLDLLDAGAISKALALADIAISPENTVESRDVLMGLFENTAGEWSFVA